MFSITMFIFADVTLLAIICTFHFNQTLSQCDYLRKPKYHWKRAAYCVIHAVHQLLSWGRTGLMVRASDSGSGDPGSILGRVGVLFP